MNAIVIYKSKTGHAKKYAEWIAEELSADLYEIHKFSIDILENYDTVIFGGGVYAGKVNGISLITSSMNYLQDKKVVVFAAGLSTPSPKWTYKLRNANIKPDKQEMIKFFYFPGGFDFSKLNFSDRMIMGMVKRRLQKKKSDQLTNSDKGTLESFENPRDNTNIECIKELIDYVNTPMEYCVPKNIEGYVEEVEDEDLDYEDEEELENGIDTDEENDIDDDMDEEENK